MKRALVVGGGGFVGSWVARELRENGWETHIAERGSPVHNQVLDLVVNCAADTDIPGSIRAPIRTTVNTVKVGLRALEAARASRCRFVHLSTEEFYGEFTLDDGWGDLHPTNPYAAAKLAQEAVAQAYQASYGVDVVVANADIVFGSGQPAHKLFPRLIHDIRAGESVGLYHHNGKPGYRHYAPVSWAASSVRYIAEMPDPPVRISLAGESLSNEEAAGRVASVLQLPLHTRPVNRPDLRPGLPGAPHGVPVRTLGWHPVTSFDDELRAML